MCTKLRAITLTSCAAQLCDSREWRWWLKQRCRFSPAVSGKHGAGNAASLLQGLNEVQLQRLLELRSTHVLDDWPRLCTTSEYQENLWLLDLLVQHVQAPPHAGQGLDVGCRAFQHLPALSAFMPGAWQGVELDAHARYWNGRTRRAYGEWRSAHRQDCRYAAGSVLDIAGHYDLITWVLPFVLPEPLDAWGLPARFFQPLQLLQHVGSLLKPEGVLFVVNQGEAEATEQQRLFTEAGFAATALGELHSVFSPFRLARYGWCARLSLP